MKILNFGSLNVDDIFIVDSIVLPGQTISSTSFAQACGGKGLNQSIATAKAGANIYHAGAIGKNDKSLLQGMLEENGVDTRFLDCNHAHSGRALIQCDKEGQNCIVLYGGANQEIKTPFIDEVLKEFGENDILMLQNEISNISYLMEQAKQKKMKICFNPSPANQTLFTYPMELVDVLILNEFEGKELTQETEEDKILDCLLTKFPNIKIVLTLGEQGSIYAEQEKRIKQQAFNVSVVDTTAAGDTFTGYFITLFFQGETIETALRLASAASAIAVGKQGAANSIPTMDAVKEFCSYY